MASEPAALLTRALGADAEPPGDPVSDRILDAALDLAAASGIRHLTMEDVARRAGVGRMTVYRRFGDKQGLLDALAIRESRRCLAELDAAITSDAPLEEQIAEGFVASLRIARQHPLLNRLARFEPEAVLEALLAHDGRVFAAARAFAAARLRPAASSLPVEAEEAAELLVRVGVSFVLIQESVLPLEEEERARDLARRLIAPVLAAA